ncbi:MAG: hypothetical protein QXY39_08470 [Thermofilaceae archaeon]
MRRTSARRVLREALRAHRVETLTALLGQEAELVGRVVAAGVVKNTFVVTLFAPWPEPGALSLWFARPPAELGLPEAPEAWAGRLVRVRGIIRPGTAEQTFWVGVSSSDQIAVLAEKPVAD